MGLLVREAEGPATVLTGARAIYRATAFNYANPSEAEKREINWLIRCNGEDYLKRDAAGDALTVEFGDELAGRTLLVMPYVNSPTPSVSVVTLVRSGPGQVLRQGLGGLRRDFADILGDASPDLPDRELGQRVESLKFAVDDLLDSVDPLWSEDDGDEEAERRLAIIVGHSESRPGARALPPIDQNEYPFNKRVARLMEQAAADRGIAARTFLRDGIGIRGAYEAAAAYEPDAIIELHFNSFHDAGVRGTETLYSEANRHSKRLAEIAQQAMVRIFARGGRTDRGVKMPRPNQSGYVNVTAAPGVPSALVEPFFGSSEQECRLAAEKAGEYAEGLVKAFEAFSAET